jgi:hypothetical protein
MNWAFLLVVFAALCGLGLVIAVMVMVFRAATRSSDRPPGDTGSSAVPPVLTDDSLTNPASPLYHLHHPTDPGPSPSSFDSGPSSSPSFDSGSSASPSFDSGSSSMSSDSGSNCG